MIATAEHLNAGPDPLLPSPSEPLTRAASLPPCAPIPSSPPSTPRHPDTSTPPPDDPPFCPSPSLASEAINALAGHRGSLTDVASFLDTNVEALADWMQRPEIAARLASLRRAAAAHAGLLAINELPQAVGALRYIVDTYSWQETHIPFRIDTPRALEQRRRAADTARRAAWLLWMISRPDRPPRPYQPRWYRPPACPPSDNLHNSPHTERAATTSPPSPLAGEGGASPGEGSSRSTQHAARSTPQDSGPRTQDFPRSTQHAERSTPQDFSPAPPHDPAITPEPSRPKPCGHESPIRPRGPPRPNAEPHAPSQSRL